MNMMIERVRRAAASSMALRSSSSGRCSVRSLPSADHETSTPMLVSTSRSRLTSSMWAMPLSTVRPRLSRLAHSRATAAFLLERTRMEPSRWVSPLMRKFRALVLPGTMRGDSRALAIRLIISRDRFWCPDSIRWIALWLVLSSEASWFCVMPRCLRASRMRRPMFAGVGSCVTATS